MSLGFIESFKVDMDNWHMSFHYKAELGDSNELKLSDAVAAAGWFELGKPPERSDVAHHGWGLSTLREIMRKASA